MADALVVRQIAPQGAELVTLVAICLLMLALWTAARALGMEV